MPRIRDIMTPDPIAIDAGASTAEATRLMLDYRVGGLPVVHRGLVVGIITHADLLARLAPRKRLPWWTVFIDHERLARDCQRARGTTVGEVMTAFPLVVVPDDAIEAAVHLLRESRIGRVPVVDHGRLVGIVSHSDVLRTLSGARRGKGCPEDRGIPMCGYRVEWPVGTGAIPPGTGVISGRWDIPAGGDQG